MWACGYSWTVRRDLDDDDVDACVGSAQLSPRGIGGLSLLLGHTTTTISARPTQTDRLSQELDSERASSGRYG